MSQENLQFSENPENFDEIIGNLIENPEKVNQIINIFLPNQQIDIDQYQSSFISYLSSRNSLPNEIISSSEFLTFFSIGLLFSRNIFTNQKLDDCFFQNWEKTFNKDDEINFSILYQFAIIFHQLFQNYAITRNQLTKITSIFIHFLKIDCISYKFPNTLLFSILDCFDLYFQTFESPEMKQIITSICAQYTHAAIYPFKILLATRFLIRNSTNYDDDLQLITHTLQTFNKFHFDSLNMAFSLISETFSNKLKECSPWSISDAYSAVSKFSITNAQIVEEQINALLTLNFYGIEKRIENQMMDFDRTINFLSNENSDIPLIQICKTFRFSPTISIRNSQVYILFQLYSIISESILRNVKSNLSIYQLMAEMESFGRNLTYFQNIVNSLLFLNEKIDHSMFYSVIEFKKPIINRFMNVIENFFLINIEFSSKYEYPADECYEYRDSCDDLLREFAAKCKENVIIQRIWDIVNFTTKKIIDIIRLFPKSIISILFSRLINLLFKMKYNRLYTTIILSFFTNMKYFLDFIGSFYIQILNNIHDISYINNCTIFLKWTNQALRRKPQKVIFSESFINQSKNFVVEFIQHAFSNSNSICLYSSLLKQNLKLIKKLFNYEVLLQIIPCPILTSLYFHIPSYLKEHQCLVLFLINLYPSHKSILMKFEWYARLLLKYAILKPKITIPAIDENRLIFTYKNTEEFEKFAGDLYVIFDKNKDNSTMKKYLIGMLSQIPAKYTEYKVAPINDIAQSWIITLVHHKKELILDCKQLFYLIREIITCEKPENQFERFVSIPSQLNFEIETLNDIFKFLIEIAFAIHKNCQSVEQYLFIQDILTLIFKFDTNHSTRLQSYCTPSFSSHCIVCLVLNHFYSGNDEDELNSKYHMSIVDSHDFFIQLLPEIECILYIISYPNYNNASIIGKFLTNHFSKSSFDFLAFTKFVLKFILRQLDEKLLVPSHHSLDDEIRFPACHYLPSHVFDIVFFIKDNIYDYNFIDFLPLFDLKLPLIATFALCEIVSKTQFIENQGNETNSIQSIFESIAKPKQSIKKYLDKYLQFDLNQLAPLLLLLPSYQEQYINSYIKALSMINQNQSLPILFYLLDLPSDLVIKNIQIIIDQFFKLNPIEALIIANAIQKVEYDFTGFVDSALTNIDLHSQHFISIGLSDFKHLLALFVIKPDLIIETLYNQLILLHTQKLNNFDLIHTNYHTIVNFLTLPMVIKYLDAKLYKRIGKCFLKIHTQYSFDETDLLVIYFSYNPGIWTNYIKKHIVDDSMIFFFYENWHNEKLSQIIVDIKDDSDVLTRHMQNEFVQFFATENSSISYNLIKESFSNYFTKCDRRYQQEMIAYLVDNGEIWDLILTFLKSNKDYLIKALKLEIAKNDNHDFETLPHFAKNLPQEYFHPFFSFVFECYHNYFDQDSFSKIVQNIQIERLGAFYGIANRFEFKFELDFTNLNSKIKKKKNKPKETRSVYDDYELNMLSYYTRNEKEIQTLICEFDIDSPSYLFTEFEKLNMTFDVNIIKDLMIRFIFNKKYFLSILKYIDKNYEHPFEFFSNELFTFVEFNLFDFSEYEINISVDCFNILSHFLSNTSDEFDLFHFWAQKLLDISVIILPKFVKDTNYFHHNYQNFFNSLDYLCSLFKSESTFLKVYFNLFAEFYRLENQFMIQELFEYILLFCDYINQFDSDYLNAFVQLSIDILKKQSKSIFPYALLAMKKLNQNGCNKIPKQLPVPFNFIVKNKLDQISLSKLNFNSTLSFLNSFKNAFYRWFLKDQDTEFYQSVMNKVGENSELGTWLAFERSALSNDFLSAFNDDTQIDHFFKAMPYSIIQMNRTKIVHDWSIPIFYFRQLQYEQRKSKEKSTKRSTNKNSNDLSNFFRFYSIENYSNVILRDVENCVLNQEINSDELNFLSGVASCLRPQDSNDSNKSSKHKKESKKFSLFEDAMEVIGTPKCYPHQIIEKLGRFKDQITSLNSSEIIQYLCICSLSTNPIVPPYFTRYHSIELFDEFNRILEFATTKGISVDFTPMEKVYPFIVQSQGKLDDIEALQEFPKTKADFLIYELSTNFKNPMIWANLKSIENDDILYLLLHSNKLPEIAKKEILKQIHMFPFRWSQILFDDIQQGKLSQSFISLIHDVFRVDYFNVFSEVVSCDELKKIRSKSYFETKILEDDHVSHNFNFSANPLKKTYSLMPVQAPLTENGPLSLFNFPMHAGLIRIDQPDQSFASFSITLSDGTKVEYVITGMIDNLSLELPLLTSVLNKIMRKRTFLRDKRVNLISPYGQLISEENNSKLFIFKTTAKPLLRKSIYSELVKAKREGEFPPMKELNPFLNFESKPEFYSWEQTFLHRFAALSHLYIGLNKKIPLPFHLLIDETNAAIELIYLRENSTDELEKQQLRLFGKIMDYISPKMANETIPIFMVNIAASYRFNEPKINLILTDVLSQESSENMKKFTEMLNEPNGAQFVEHLIGQSCQNISVLDIPWF